MKQVAVVILNWNGEKLLEAFLPTVLSHSDEASIYVADNASDDGSIALLANKFPAVKVIRNAGNFGFAQGYNDALKHVEEEIYALVNSDVEVTEGWLAPIIALFEKEPDTAIIQPKILDHKNKDYFEYAGAAGGFIDQFGYPFCRGRIFDSMEKDQGQYDDVKEIFWASGACFFVRKEVFRELKCFDADYFAHQEEIDLCWRAFNRNYKIKYCGKSTVYHVGGATLDSQNPTKTYLNFRNSLATLVKNVPQHKLLFILTVRLILDGAAGVQFLFQGKFAHIVSILKAHGSFYWNFEKNYNKRGLFQNRRYFLVRNIVFAYFIKKKQVFRDLL